MRSRVTEHVLQLPIYIRYTGCFVIWLVIPLDAGVLKSILVARCTDASSAILRRKIPLTSTARVKCMRKQKERKGQINHMIVTV
jgi:hypothetical protein